MIDGGRENPAATLARGELARFLGPEALAALDRYLDARLAALPKASAERRWLLTEEAASYIGCSAAAMRKKLDRGQLKRHRLGGRLYVDRAELDQVLANEQ
jgi:excisionase family DNA binding protein